MKKFAWIIALLAALSLGFFACTEPDGTAYQPVQRAAPETEWTVIFDMQNPDGGLVEHGIQELAEGALTIGTGEANNPIRPLVRAGGDTFTIVKEGGKNAFKYTTSANWGPGFDIPLSVFGLQGGDKITVTGTAAGTAIDLALNRNVGSDQQILGNRITSAGAFTITATLSAADIAQILVARGNDDGQKVIRFEDRVSGTTVTITQIKIEGDRPSNIRTLDTPAVNLTGSTMSWSAITGASGYKLYANDTLFTTLLSTTTSVNLRSAFNGKTAGAYSVKLIAAGTTGVTRDSAESNTVNYTYAAYNDDVTIKVNGVDQTAKLKLIGTTAELETITDGFKVNGGYNAAVSFPIITYDFGTTIKLSDIASIKFNAKQGGGDVTYKRFQVLAADTESTSFAANSFKVVTRKTTNRWEGFTAATPSTLAVNLPVFGALVTDSGIKDKSKLAFSLNPAVGATAVYEITDIEITTGGNALDETIVGTLLNISLATPVTGQAPVTSITKADGGENTVYTGTVRWLPPVGSTFDSFSRLQATIVLTPAKTYKMPEGPFGDIEDPDDGDNSGDPYVGFTVYGAVPDAITYSNGLVGIVFTFPDQTLALGPLGEVYNLLKDGSISGEGTISAYWTFGDYDLGNQRFRAHGIAITKTLGNPLTEDEDEDGTPDGLYLTIPARTSNWNSLLIVTSGDDAGNYGPNIENGFRYGRSHKITVIGKTENGNTVRFDMAGSPYTTYSGAVTAGATDGKFTLTRTFTWKEIVDCAEGISIRTLDTTAGAAAPNTGYDVYNVIIEAVAD